MEEEELSYSHFSETNNHYMQSSQNLGNNRSSNNHQGGGLRPVKLDIVDSVDP